MISGMNGAEERDERMPDDRRHQRGLRHRERRAQHRDDDAEENETVRAPDERRTLGAGADLNRWCV